ncbi:MAG: hypothetical protein U0457_08020 [Candidatus Sericytochromatia bacterium]
MVSINNNFNSNNILNYNKKIVSNNNSNTVETNTFNNDIFFIGLNPNAKFEVNELKKVFNGKINFLENNSSQKIKINGKTSDILNYNNVSDFCKSFNLDNKITEEIRKLFSSVVSEDNKIQISSRDALKNELNKISIPDSLKSELYNQLSKTGSSFTNNEILYNLIFKDDVIQFIDSLNITKEKSTKLKDIMLNSPQNIRDELASIISIFSKAEQGEKIPNRLVISAHSMGIDYFGEKNGTLSSSSFQEIAKIFPKASEQIEDLAIMACYAGNKDSLNKYRNTFPNLKTFMGYIDSAPGSYSGATKHLKIWAKETTGDKNIFRESFLNTRKGNHVVTWNEKTGFLVDPLIEKEMNARRGFIDVVNYIVPIYPKYSEEDFPVKDPSNCDLRDAYSQIQRVLGDPDNTFEESQKQWLIDMKNMFIRLLYYPQVAEKFDNAYKNQISKAYQALNLKEPNFASISRAEARAEINKLQKAYEEIMNNPSFKEKSTVVKNTLDLLNKGLILLNSNLIPDNWV